MAKSVFEISYNELLMALNEGPSYKLYRVYGVLSEQPTFEKVENVAAHLREKQLDLYIGLPTNGPTSQAHSVQEEKGFESNESK